MKLALPVALNPQLTRSVILKAHRFVCHILATGAATVFGEPAVLIAVGEVSSYCRTASCETLKIGTGSNAVQKESTSMAINVSAATALETRIG